MSSLGEEEWQRLQELLAPGPLAVEGTIGLLTAVVSQPRLLTPSEWMPVVLPGSQDPESMFLVLQLYNEVNQTLAGGGAWVPGAEDVAGVVRFCRGYLQGAGLDAGWPADDEVVKEGMVTVMAAAEMLPAEIREGAAEVVGVAREELAEAVGEIYEHLRTRRAVGLARGERTEPAAVAPGTMSFTQNGKIPVRTLRGFFEVMAEVRRAAPWKTIAGEPIGIRAPKVGFEDGIVVLTGEERPGFYVFRSFEDARRYGSGDETVEVFLATWVNAKELHPGMRKELKKLNLARGGGTVPVLMKLDAQQRAVPNEPEDFALAILVAVGLRDLAKQPVPEGLVAELVPVAAWLPDAPDVKLVFPHEAVGEEEPA